MKPIKLYKNHNIKLPWSSINNFLKNFSNHHCIQCADDRSATEKEMHPALSSSNLPEYNTNEYNYFPFNLRQHH